MKSVPSLLFFKPMKEEPHAGIRKSPFVKSGIEDGHGRELKPPYRPGEKCYVREAWKLDRIEDELVIRYKSDNAVIYIHESNDSDVLALIDRKRNPWSWRSPVTMPQWAARRFVTILSCEPMKVEDITDDDADWRKRHPGKEWAWRVESKEDSCPT
jgi:hypothetical protein